MMPLWAAAPVTLVLQQFERGHKTSVLGHLVGK